MRSMIESFTVFSMPGCPFCSLVKVTLRHGGHHFTEFSLEQEDRAEFKRVLDVKTFPQVFHAGRYVGGYEDTKAYLGLLV